MSDQGSIEVAEPTAVAVAERATDKKQKKQPRYNVVLWDDDDHSYDYVITMMMKLFGHTIDRGYIIAKQVDAGGKAICLTTTMEHAELKRDQIHAFGKDHHIDRCKGSMTATIEPAPGD